jgi:hypothetical protein
MSERSFLLTFCIVCGLLFNCLVVRLALLVTRFQGKFSSAATSFFSSCSSSVVFFIVFCVGTLLFLLLELAASC